MFNDSYLRACMILWLVKKLDFAFLSLGGPSHGDRVWCLGRVPVYFLPLVPMLWHSAETPNPGTMPWSAQTQEGKIYFFAQFVISYTLLSRNH